ncbi:hypothetical protein F4808DRAFT_41859 [Astrocystis sublimbata]|nr:hypothetical protein F4808DRAFT_41859 [Astrocystis sublimbata]
MAGTSPTRRSSRARITQSQSQVSSTTSSTSGRVERSTRGFTKTGSPQKSTGSASLSSEPPEDSTTTDDTVLRRRSTRANGKDDDREKHPRLELVDMPSAPDDIQEDDESVRCICGHDDYPGPPPFDEDSKHGVKDAIDHKHIFAIEITDELAGFFVQCEICNTWQHGACVGFTTEESNPEDVEYYCEQCRKDLHKIFTASNGQKYSIFLPIHRPSQAVSRATSAAKEEIQSPKPGSTKTSRAAAAAAAAQHASKRRSTMNSRDAAYDEEEQLRRAIEASKEETAAEEGDLASRRPKRGRDDSEDKTAIAKRQRTNSKSPSPAPENPDSNTVDESDDELALRNGHSKRSRNTVRNARERAEREERREEQERKRAEAASKRKGRAERRRADDSDPSDEVPLATRGGASRATESAQPPDLPPPSSQPPPDTPPVSQPQAPATGKKKAAQTKKKGRNQYTKDRDNEHEDSPARSISREFKNADESGGGSGSGGGGGGGSNGTSSKNTSSHEATTTGKHTKGRGGMSSKVTMSDMKRRVHGILEFITRKQVELVNDPLSDSASSPSQPGTEGANTPTTTTTKVNGDSLANKKADAGTPGAESGEAIDPSLAFKDMNCIEMMDSLTRDLMKWQQEFIH